MASLNVKNIPDDLYALLKESAKLHFRSMNGEVLHCMESTLRTRKVVVDEELAKFRHLRKLTASKIITEKEITKTKNEGRE
ncbi:MAG: hypothetical protein MAG581_01534 [Deltaproteobacteria bacterium]|jgi:plasmid stability protein|nr:hypothetical protein [Deltaproteobacteria bacterium]